MNWPIERFDSSSKSATAGFVQQCRYTASSCGLHKWKMCFPCRQQSFGKDRTANKLAVAPQSISRSRSSASSRTRWQSYDADVGIEVLLSGELAIVEDHSTDEDPD